MVLIRSFFIILALVLASGCTAVQVRPVDTELEIKHVCIEDGQQMCFDGEMMGVIRDGFERHGITTQIYTGNLPSECEYHLSYMCNQTWDLAMYMHHAELRLYRAQARIGYAEYHLKGQGGLSLMKWESTKKKMDPVIDQLLSGYPIVNLDLYVVQPKTQSQATTTKKDIEPRAQTTDQSQDSPKLAAIPKDAPVVQVSLRRQPTEIYNQTEVTDMLIEYDFFDRSRNAHGSFVNDFVDNNDDTVTDKATGLMWHKGGSSSSLENRNAKRYIKQLNKQRFAGHSDWRIPTIAELASLLVNSKINGLHVNPLFSSKQKRCWTIDQGEGNDRYYLGGWIVNFELGEVRKAQFLKPSYVITGTRALNRMNYVKAVRSLK